MGLAGCSSPCADPPSRDGRGSGGRKADQRAASGRWSGSRRASDRRPEDRLPLSDTKKYIQHNLAVADGLEGVGTLLKQLPPNSAKVKTVRVFRDGDFVFTHTDFFGPKVGFDVFRFEDGKVVEHWDAIEAIPPKSEWKNDNGKF